MAICPKCRCELPEVGMRCENDGWFGIAPEDFDENNNILGRPLGGGFVALHKLGQGGMGTVYEGRQTALNRVVAIKVLSRLHLTDEQVLTRFEREAKSVARVVHPNVVQLIDSGIEDNDIAYIVMEYVQGVELSNLADSEFSAQFIVHVAHQVLNALSEAHAMNVIHRDLKPDNIMVTSEDGDNHFVKVLDFGLASLSDGSRITVAGQALGTPWYMSPEQATASPVTEASDIYSLGCVLYEMAVSKPPFPGNRPYNVMMQHVNAQVPELMPRPGVEPSDELVQFIMKCLEKEPADRYSSANDALEALHNLPEWTDNVQCDPSQSIKLSIMQLSEMGRKSSGIIGEISEAIASGESSAVIRDAVQSASTSSNNFKTVSRDDEDEFDTAATVPSLSAFTSADVKHEIKKAELKEKGGDGLDFLLHGKNLKILIAVGVVVTVLLIIAIILAIMD